MSKYVSKKARCAATTRDGVQRIFWISGDDLEHYLDLEFNADFPEKESAKERLSFLAAKSGLENVHRVRIETGPAIDSINE